MDTDTTSVPSGQSDADLHDGYIQAVITALATRGVPTASARIGHTGVRHAQLTVTRRKRAQPMLLLWDEVNGWSLHDRRPGRIPAVFFGLTAVPPPEILATWVVLLAAQLEATVIRTGEPFAPRNIDHELRTYQQPPARTTTRR